MSRAPARPTDRKPHVVVRRAASRTGQPTQLTKAELELGDGRYLLAYGYRVPLPADA